ncbi:MAG: hypothetical protein JO025_16555 [Verrucomicrobia bacterium]|nr:hypothetical protein [Verrucomicrobiota bacterium]
MKINLSHAPATERRLSRFPEATTIAKLIGFVVTGMLCIFTAILTTVVESGGFWQYFWLGVCITLFVFAFSFIIWATKDGLRIDHAGLRFEAPETSSVSVNETEIGQDLRIRR